MRRGDALARGHRASCGRDLVAQFGEGFARHHVEECVPVGEMLVEARRRELRAAGDGAKGELLVTVVDQHATRSAENFFLRR